VAKYGGVIDSHATVKRGSNKTIVKRGKNGLKPSLSLSLSHENLFLISEFFMFLIS